MTYVDKRSFHNRFKLFWKFKEINQAINLRLGSSAQHAFLDLFIILAKFLVLINGSHHQYNNSFPMFLF